MGRGFGQSLSSPSILMTLACHLPNSFGVELLDFFEEEQPNTVATTNGIKNKFALENFNMLNNFVENKTIWLQE
jgi:hypothetical protein